MRDISVEKGLASACRAVAVENIDEVWMTVVNGLYHIIEDFLLLCVQSRHCLVQKPFFCCIVQLLLFESLALSAAGGRLRRCIGTVHRREQIGFRVQPEMF